MKEPKTLLERDLLIDKTIKEISETVKKKRIEKDKKGQWFANSQLNNLRQLLEGKGYKTARLYLIGKIESSGNRWERERNEALLQVLDILGNESNKLELIICSYILGKLNPIITEKYRR